MLNRKRRHITDKPSSALLDLPSFSPKLPLIRQVLLSNINNILSKFD